MDTSYKALVVDFDNTLADLQTHQITSEVREAIHQLLESNVFVSIVTGKPFAGVIENACRELGLQNPQIVHGGAEIIDPQTQTVIWGRYIADDKTKEIISYLQKNKIFFTVEKKNFVYTPGGARLKFYGESMQYKDIKELDIDDIPKIVVPATINKFTKAEVESIINHMQTLYKDLNIIKGGIREYFGFDITHLEATKHTALLEYMKILNLKPEEVVGVGDGYNDYPLLTACGVKVAMGDAPAELKDIADLVVLPQKENGLVTVIEKYFTHYE